ncbi:hypothetical protein APUTEX25_002630 [Auxenochlorella protothecoides]|uniref:Uncharacterized protein n=1 Tax=Auxenochlorella protothecoides TaxID=3075 RepID=A0A3M7KU42_AUXPR|nr:hypothetical protein APUTEX25_002630 [Auxenochlorella protothecoides]|eukprot:RMZ54053.1 hypothetical protein APUTEX25_002630 [Auxenochlorella protothecoides]
MVSRLLVRVWGWRRLRTGVAPEGAPPSVTEVPCQIKIHPEPGEATTHTAETLVQSYQFPGDRTSSRRYWLLFSLLLGSILWWLGPLMGIFVLDPFLQLLLDASQVITPDTDCYDNRMISQSCKSETFIDYYFFNITNAEQWLAGTEPPAYHEVGPYTFATGEKHFDVQYSSDWSTVSYSYYQWQTLRPDLSCAGCSMSDTIVGVNRGYQQLLQSAAGAAMDAETGMIYSFMPSVLFTITASIDAALRPATTLALQGFGITDPVQVDAAVTSAVASQWAACGALLAAMSNPASGVTSPFLSSLGPFPYPPEFCAYLPGAMAPYLGFQPDPSQFGVLGLAMDTGAAAAFLAAAKGATNATAMDPAGAAFLGAFLTTPRAALLAGLAAAPATQALAQVLTPITATQWGLLQGYLVSLVPTWGTLVYRGFLQSFAGGAGLVLTKTVDQWLNGYEDPILLLAAKQLHPTTWQLMPWTYTPQLALAFPTEDAPLRFFQQTTGAPMAVQDLSYRASDIGRYLPLIQQRALSTGQAANSTLLGVEEYRGVPFVAYADGIMNMTGISEGLLVLDTNNPATQPIIFEAGLLRPLQTRQRGTKSSVKKIHTVQFAIDPVSLASCNASAYAAWAQATQFDQGKFQTAIGALTAASNYWDLVQNDMALTTFFEGTRFGSLGPYFGTEDPQRDRCLIPDEFEGVFDLSAVFSCPTLFSFPHFYLADERIVNSTGQSEWQPDPVSDGWYFDVEPFTSFTVGAHKVYQVNNLVSRSAHAYPNLWVAPGSGQAAGRAADFVTVPSFHLLMYWQPTDTNALVIRGLVTAQSVLYYTLVVACPVAGWLALIVSLLLLHATSAAKARRLVLARLQKSRARSTRLGKQEAEMVEALVRVARGSANVVVPLDVSESLEEATEQGESGSDDGAQRPPAAAEDPFAARKAAGDQGHNSAPLDALAGKVAALEADEQGDSWPVRPVVLCMDAPSGSTPPPGSRPRPSPRMGLPVSTTARSGESGGLIAAIHPAAPGGAADSADANDSDVERVQPRPSDSASPGRRGRNLDPVGAASPA